MPSMGDIGTLGVTPPAPNSPVSNGRSSGPSIAGSVSVGENPIAVVFAVVGIFVVLGILRVAFEVEVKK